MRISIVALILLALPGGALAQEWRKLAGSGIMAALTARVLGYPDGTLQDFFATGRTLIGDKEGDWKVAGDLFCQRFAPAQDWSCYGVEAGRRGLDIRFTAPDGTGFSGRYVDLG